MKDYAAKGIRNFAIAGHGGSGKTMLAEAMLSKSGEINRLGSIESGSTVSDYHQDEHDRQISIHSSPLHLEWNDTKFNLIDTPGYLDFIGETISSLAVVDAAVVVVHAVNGVEVGTEQVWNYASNYGLTKILVVNGLDREHTQFDKVLQQAKDHFGSNVFPMQLPVNEGPGFNQIIDVLRSELITYSTDGSGKYSESDIPEDWKDKIKTLHEELIEYVAESDDSLLEKFFEEGNLTEEEMREGLHHAIQNQVFIPLFCTASTQNIGAARLMDFISKYGSSPKDRGDISVLDSNGNETKVSINDSETVAQVFKTISEEHIGEMSFFRVYSGKVNAGDDLRNTTRNNSEKMRQVYFMNGKNRKDAPQLIAGDIGAALKLKNTHTGDTLADPKGLILLPKINYPTPNMSLAIKPKARGDEEKIANGLAVMHEEDPTFLYRVDSELKQTIISGQGELHLNIALNRITERFHVELEKEVPRVPYRETITGKAESKYRHKKQSGGSGQFAEVWLRVEAANRGDGIDFKNSLVGQNVDRGFVPSVEKGIHNICDDGVIAGCKVVDVKIDFYDGKMHPVDSKDIAFQTAGKNAFIDAFKNASPCLQEPIINIEVKVPEEYMGDIMGDISGKRGKILGMDSDGSFQLIKAQVPQAELYNYATTIRSLTGGRGIHAEEFSHYEKMPKDAEKKVIASKQKQEDE